MARLLVALVFYSSVLGGLAGLTFAVIPRRPAAASVDKADRMAGLSLSDRLELAYKDGDFSLVLLLCDELVGSEPTAVNYYRRASFREMTGRLNEAAEDLTEAIRLMPNFTQAQERRAWLYLQLGNHTQALEDFTRCIQSPAAAHGEFHLGRALAYFMLDEPEKAADDMTVMIKRVTVPGSDSPSYFDPQIPLFHRDRAACYRLAGKADKAIADCTQAIDRDPSSLMNYAERAKAYIVAGDFSRAIDDANKAVSSPGTSDSVYDVCGQANLDGKYFDEALSAFNRAIALNPRHTYFAHRSIAYAGLGKHELAKEDATRAELMAKKAKPTPIRWLGTPRYVLIDEIMTASEVTSPNLLPQRAPAK
jgi:tetratricopeptide (TPR) repeat protein